MNLYTKYAKDFSTTRQIPWEGWKNVLSLISNLEQPIRILDLGCGNGRFLKFLIEQHIQIDSYTGIDNSSELLNIAKKEFKNLEINSNFLNLDLNQPDWAGSLGEFDLIVAFGLMHHLESEKARKELLERSAQHLTRNGLSVVTFWMFKENEDFLSKHIVKDLGNNDFILSFAENAERFCHYSDQREITSYYESINLDKVKIFRSDGFQNEMNQYEIWRKN